MTKGTSIYNKVFWKKVTPHLKNKLVWYRNSFISRRACIFWKKYNKNQLCLLIKANFVFLPLTEKKSVGLCFNMVKIVGQARRIFFDEIPWYQCCNNNIENTTDTVLCKPFFFNPGVSMDTVREGKNKTQLNVKQAAGRRTETLNWRKSLSTPLLSLTTVLARDTHGREKWQTGVGGYRKKHSQCWQSTVCVHCWWPYVCCVSFWCFCICSN